ncbi:MAG TPA: pyridoxamine 5'-phosphate oxidase family protein, partial [Thermoanaerobaculia bacterium]
MSELKETDLDPNPFAQFERWFGEARQAQPELPEAMTVATVGAGGVVSARVCLLKAFDQHGFVFYTNFHSRKAEQISVNPHVGLC